MRLGKCMARAIIRGYDILLTGDVEIPAGNADKNGVTATLKLLKNSQQRTYTCTRRYDLF